MLLPIVWWYEHSGTYPCLSCMALNYLTIPSKPLTPILTLYFIINAIFTATSVKVEQLFSRGCLLLTYVHSHLSVQSIHALLCLGIWSKLDLIKNADVRAVSELPVALGDEAALKDG